VRSDVRGNGRLSVVVPCYNEQAVIATTHRRLVDVLAGLPAPDWEVLYVDDGSRDATLTLLRDIRARDPRVRVLSLSRNFGHQIAVSAGLEAAAGAAVVLIDADLQDPPELIPDMLARWRDGADVVYGERAARAGETGFKQLTASLFYRLINRISATPIPIDTGDFRLMDRRVVDSARCRR
jgi:polyisoprenyl-phosphate glycosyltransferase